MHFKTLKKFAAVAMAVTLCVPAFATQVSAENRSGSFNTSFDVYSPDLTVQVPLDANIRVNPLADSALDTVGKFEVASNSIDIWNASVDADADKAIPVNVKINAAIASTGDDVITTWNTFTADKTSAVKKINLNLSQAGTAAVLGAAKDDQGVAVSPAFDEKKKLDLSKYAVATAAKYDSPVQSVAITPYGSMLSVDIAGPTLAATKTSYVTDAADVSPTVASFAVTGTANVGASWKADDITVDIVYDIRPSAALGIVAPTIAAAPTYNGTSKADVSITVPNVGEATVDAVAVHNDLILEREDYVFESVTVDYTTTAGSAIVKVDKDDEILSALGEIEGQQVYDVVIALSDGRMVVTKLTVN